MKINLQSQLVKMIISCFYLSFIVLTGNFMEAQTCTTSTNQNTYGTNSWIGHVYDSSGTNRFATYKGYTTETETFTRNWGNGKPSCAANANNFAVRYRMTKTFAAGNYIFTIGGDDGMRLSIDGGTTWILSDWVDHSYRDKTIEVPMSSGTYNLVLEYYENTGDAQVSFSYGPSVALNTNNIPAKDITQNINNNVIYSFKISATNASATLSGLKIITAGNYAAGDVNNLKVRYSTDATLDAGDATLSTYNNPGTAGSKTFPSFTNQTIAKDATGYIFITTDTPCSVIGRTISASVVPSDTTFLLGTATGTPAVGNAQTFTAATPVNVTGATASIANASSAVSWTSPTGCSSEVMIVASPAANTGGTPTGDGSAYTANLTYGSGTTFGNGRVVYKGIVSPEVIIGLTNGTPYFYKIFTRNGTKWSAGVEVTATPALTYCTPTEGAGSTTYYLNGISTSGGTSNLSYTASSYAAYVNNSAKTFSGSPGTAISTSLSANTTDGYWYAWVDWNNDGDFLDAGENSFAVTTYTTSPYNGGVITVPPGQTPGNYRVRFNFDYIFTSTSCAGGGYGNYVDFTLTVAPLSPCTSPNPPTALNLTLSGTVVNGSFTPPTTLPTGYVIARSTSNVMLNPGNGSNYTTGATVAGYYIVRGTDTPSNTTTFTDTPGIGVFYYYVFSFNRGCSGAPFYSAGISNSLNTCQPKSTSSARYISNVQFLGTLNPDTGNPTEYSTNGYGDFTNKTEKAKQMPGGVINLNVSIAGPLGDDYGTIKAWVDWNRDGVFNDDLTERTYSSDDFNILSTNVIFGFIVKTTTLPGNYTIRIRTNRDNTEFGPCGTLPNGETEDYTFIVEEKCSAEVITLTAAQSCGPGPVVLTATGTSDTTSYKWYKTEFGAEIAGANSNVYTTDNLPVGSYTYYASAFNGTCWSNLRKPIKFSVQPIPTITFYQSAPDICGSITNLTITSSGDKQQVMLLEEPFESATQQFFNDPPTNTYPEGMWKVNVSPYIPENPHFLKPAISSGVNGSRFATIMTDLQYNASINNYFQSVNLNSSGYSDMFFEFDLYFFSDEDDIARNFLKVQYYSNTEGIWKDLDTYITDIGAPSRFVNQKYSLPTECENITDLKVRFYLFSYGDGSVWLGNIVAIDNVKIYGNKDLPAKFKWSGDTGVIYASGLCSESPDPLGSPSVCIKLSDGDLKAKSKFKITATADLSNGCKVSKTIYVDNNTKIWDTTSATEWNSSDWQPADSKIAPKSNQCVVIRTPVILGIGAEGFAKNVKVELGGKLTIKEDQSLTVTDAFIKDAAVPAADVLIESDGNLIQINEGIAINSGAITAKRDLTLSTGRLQYNYIISPLEGQSLSTIYNSAGASTASVLYHNEANNKFYNSSGAYIKGRGLAVKEPVVGFAPTEIGATFEGKPTNGAFTYPIVNSGPTNLNRGYNLVGNPYPSNIDLVKFYMNLNGGETGSLFSTAYFWDNRANEKIVQQGDFYEGQSYGQLNMTTGTGTPGSGDPTKVKTRIPTQYVKTGQAFMVKSKVSSTTITFNNTIRTKDRGLTEFFGKNADSAATPMDRYWLNMITPANLASTIAVVYFPEGNNAFTQDDSRTMGGSDAVYSIVENENVSINGRSSFINTDVIPLGTQHFATGNYTIALAQKEGVFFQDQAIYLKDKQTGTVTNLIEGDYTFEATAGVSTGRFEIIYRPEVVLVTDNKVKEGIIVYRDQDQFVIKSPKIISVIQVYDASGKLITVLKPNGQQEVFDGSSIANGMYVLKITTADGEVTNKKISR